MLAKHTVKPRRISQRIVLMVKVSLVEGRINLGVEADDGREVATIMRNGAFEASCHALKMIYVAQTSS